MLIRLLTSVVLCAVFFSAAARAEDPQPLSEGGWNFEATTYLWTPAVNGDVTVRGQKSDVNASFIDIVKDTDTLFAYNGQFGVSNGDFSLLFSPTYMKLGATDHVQLPAGRTKIDSDIEITYLELAALYRIANFTVGYDGTSPQTLSIEPLAGARYTNLHGDLTVNVAGVPGKADSENSKVWTDPIVGFRSILTLTEDIDFTVRGDVGGFGLGSEFSWQLASNLSYRFSLFNKEARAFAGYRALYQHYKDGSGANKFEWDATLYGPILGLSIAF